MEIIAAQNADNSSGKSPPKRQNSLVQELYEERVKIQARQQYQRRESQFARQQNNSANNDLDEESNSNSQSSNRNQEQDQEARQGGVQKLLNINDAPAREDFLVKDQNNRIERPSNHQSNGEGPSPNQSYKSEEAK